MAFPSTLVSWLQPLFAQQAIEFRPQMVESGTLSWITGLALLGLIFALLMAPTFEVKLNKQIINASLIAGFLLSISLVFSNALTYIRGSSESIVLLGTLSGISAGLGLFFLVMACARFAVAQGPPEAAPQERTPPG